MVIQLRSTLTATGLALVLMTTSACSAGESGPASETTAPASEQSNTSSASPSAPATPSQEATQEADANVVNGIPVKEGTVSDGRGEYRQTTITDDDPAMKYDPAKTTDIAKASFTPEELEAVQKQSVKFLAEEGLDSTANGGTIEDFKAWWAKNEGLFHPIQKEEIYNDSLANPENISVVLTSAWRGGEYGYDYSAGTRITDRDITVTSIDAGSAPDGQPFVTVRASVSFKSPIIVEGRESAEDVTGTTSYTYLKDSDGKFKIAGYLNSFDAVEGTR